MCAMGVELQFSMSFYYSSVHLVCPPPLISHPASVESCLCFDSHISHCTAARFPTISPSISLKGSKCWLHKDSSLFFPALFSRSPSLTFSNTHVNPSGERNTFSAAFVHAGLRTFIITAVFGQTTVMSVLDRTASTRQCHGRDFPCPD